MVSANRTKKKNRAIQNRNRSREECMIFLSELLRKVYLIGKHDICINGTAVELIKNRLLYNN